MNKIQQPGSCGGSHGSEEGERHEDEASLGEQVEITTVRNRPENIAWWPASADLCWALHKAEVLPELSALPGSTASSQLRWLPSSHWFGRSFLCRISAPGSPHGSPAELGAEDGDGFSYTLTPFGNGSTRCAQTCWMRCWSRTERQNSSVGLILDSVSMWCWDFLGNKLSLLFRIRTSGGKAASD